MNSIGRDIVEYLMAGSSAVQVGTAVYYHGISVFESMLKELEEFMLENDYNSVKDMIGLALGN